MLPMMAPNSLSQLPLPQHPMELELQVHTTVPGKCKVPLFFCFLKIQAGLKCRPAMCWDYRCALPCSAVHLTLKCSGVKASNLGFGYSFSYPCSRMTEHAAVSWENKLLEKAINKQHSNQKSYT